MTEGKTLAANLGDVITAYTGKMFVPDGRLVGLRNMLQFMVNRRLLLPQLGRAAEVVRPTLARKFPWLINLTVRDLSGLPVGERRVAAETWIDELAGEHGAVLQVPQLPEGLWIDMDPIAEIREMVHPETAVHAVVVGADGAQQFINPPRGTFRNPRLDEPD